MSAQGCYDTTVFSSDDSDKVFSHKRQAIKTLDEIFEGYTPEERREIIRRFEADKITNDFIRTLYDKHGLDSVLFRGMLDDFV